MRVLFRTDSATVIGAGHVMRCLTLADALRAKGADCQFICRDLPGAIHDKIEGAGFQVSVLPSPSGMYQPTADDPSHAAWLGVSWQDDLEQTKAALAGNVDWLIVDHYGIDARWLSAMRDTANHIAVIDELADRPLDCDLLVCQSLPNGMIGTAFDACLPATAQRMIGPEFALLRPEFAAVRDKAVARRADLEKPQRVFVANGYMDAGGLVPLALRALQQFPDLGVDVAIGRISPVIEEVRALAAAMPQVTLHEDAQDMAALMAAADFAIGGGGVSSFERATVGLPTLAVSVADNQADLLRYVANQGAVRLLGDLTGLDIDPIAQAIQILTDTPTDWRAMMRASLDLCDGQGADRVVAAMDTLS